MLEKLQLFLFKNISPAGLAIFRIGYGINFLLEILNIFNYRQLYFDKIPYLDFYFLDIAVLLLLWIIIIVFLILGFYTKIAAVLNYLFTIVLISSMTTYEYHMFYTYTGINFLLIFLPIHKAISLDLVKKKLEYLEKGVVYKGEHVAKINYFLPVFVGIGLFYLDSAFIYKLNSPIWLKGLGVWLPSSIPHITISENQWLLNQEFLVKLLSYLTMAFEFMFIFLFWHKRYRFLLLVIGIGLHLGIYVEFPIPYFAIGYITIYLVMVPVSFWKIFWNKIIVKKQKLFLYCDTSSLPTHKFVTIIESFDVFKAVKIIKEDDFSGNRDFVLQNKMVLKDSEGVVYTGKSLLDRIGKASFLCYIVLSLSRSSFCENSVISTLEQNEKRTIDFISFHRTNNSSLKNGFLITLMILAMLFQIQIYHSFFFSKQFSGVVHRFSKKYFGITHHDVFVDAHMVGYNNVYTLKYKGKLLPILDERGMADKYISGGSYAYWIFRVNMPYVKQNSYSLRKGIIDYTSFWMHDNDVNLSEDQEFEIVRKKVRLVFEWEEDLLEKNMSSPWEKVGSIKWKNKGPHFFWNTNNIRN